MFEPGDRVRLENGKRTLSVEQSNEQFTIARYDHNNQAMRRHTNEFVMIDGEQDMSNKQKVVGQLFETSDGRFGVGLAINSQGHYVLEMKGENGAVIPFSPENVEKVVPYTVSVKSVGASREYHYRASPDDGLQVNDVLINIATSGSPQFIMVTGVDTKYEGATKQLKGQKLLTQKVSE